MVQLDNYREMVEFIDFGKELGCDKVCFHGFFDFGTYSGPEFHRLNVLDPAHPDHADILRILSDPAFDDPIVSLGNLTATRHRALGAVCSAPA